MVNPNPFLEQPAFSHIWPFSVFQVGIYISSSHNAIGPQHENDTENWHYSHSPLPDADQITVSDSHNIFQIATDDSMVDDNRLQQTTHHD